jgi:transposase
MSAVVTGGVLYFEVIEGTFSHVEVETFLEHLRPYLMPNAVALFDNASIQVMESTLQLVDEMFVGRWVRLIEYCPHLAPIEKVFALVWNLVRRRWIEAVRHPLEILIEGFRYYSVGGPGASAITSY